MSGNLRHLVSPLLDNNPVTYQILGVCSALAVTTSLATALTMSAAMTSVLVMASAIISMIRRHLPTSIRLIVQITIISALVIVADQLLRAFAFGISEKLSIFVALIVTNCIVLGRAEGFAMHHRVWPSVLDALGNGIGYSLVLVVVGVVRELLGTGKVLGVTVLATVAEGGWFAPLSLMLLAPSAFFVIGLLLWVVHALHPAQVEEPEFKVRVAAGGREP